MSRKFLQPACLLFPIKKMPKILPWRDSVPELKKYAENKNVDANKWNLVTGER